MMMSKVLKDEGGGSSSMAQLAKRVFKARDAAHFQHWKTKSYAKHMALGSFYDDVIEQMDAIVEDFQGVKGLIPSDGDDGDILSQLQSECEWIAANREKLAGGVPSVLNKIDDLIGIYTSTIYKLKHLG